MQFDAVSTGQTSLVACTKAERSDWSFQAITFFFFGSNAQGVSPSVVLQTKDTSVEFRPSTKAHSHKCILFFFDLNGDKVNKQSFCLCPLDDTYFALD